MPANLTIYPMTRHLGRLARNLVFWDAALATLVVLPKLVTGNAIELVVQGGAWAFWSVAAILRSARRAWTTLGSRAVLTSYILVIAAASLADFASRGVPRIALVLGDANTFGGSVAIATIGMFAVIGEPGPAAALLLAGSVGVLLSGSRGALLALVLGIVVLGLGPARRRVVRAVGIVVATSVLLGVVALGLVRLQPKSPNLLRFSNDLTSTVWHESAEAAEVTRAQAPGPVPGARVFDLATNTRATDSPSIVALRQSYGWVAAHTVITASVYVRSTASTEMRLSNNVTARTCPVDTRWHRCTVSGSAPGRRYAFLDVSFTPNGDSSSLQLSAPQLEFGSIATSPVLTQSSYLGQLRYRLTELHPFERNAPLRAFRSRLQAWLTVSQTFVGHPVMGASFHEVWRPFPLHTKFGVINHPHSVILYVFATLGLLGVASMVLHVLVLRRLGMNVTGPGIAATLTTVAVLAAVDMTLLSPWLYGPFFLAILALPMPSDPAMPGQRVSSRGPRERHSGVTTPRVATPETESDAANPPKS